MAAVFCLPPSGSSCSIFPCGFNFPRYVGSERGPLYTRKHLALEGLEAATGWKLPDDTTALGSIPQLEHTYAYMDGSYGQRRSCHSSAACSASYAWKWVSPHGRLTSFLRFFHGRLFQA